MDSDDVLDQASAVEMTPRKMVSLSPPKFAPYSFSKLCLRDTSILSFSCDSSDDEMLTKKVKREKFKNKKKTKKRLSLATSESGFSQLSTPSSDSPLVERNDSEVVLEIITDFIRGRNVPGITHGEIELVQKAMRIVMEGIEAAKKGMPSEADPPGLVKMNIGLHTNFEGDRIPVISLSSDSEPEDKKDAIVLNHNKKRADNVSRSDFEERISKGKQYLRMKKMKPPVDTESLDLRYPLGVTFDDVTNNWYVTEPMTHTVIKIHVGSDRYKKNITELKHRKLRNPSSICVLDEGNRLAVLCSEDAKMPSICFIDIQTDEVSNFCSWYDKDLGFHYAARGLARSLGMNLLTMDRPIDNTPRLCIFSTDTFQKKTFKLPGADLPSFIATSGSTVVITDLGSRQSVLQCKLDDTNFDKIDFQILREFSTAGVRLSSAEMLNEKYFVYVAGAQIDRHGNIIIADAKNHHFKLFDRKMRLKHRISTDFPVPYVSSFHVNQYGEILILSTREQTKISFARLSSSNRLQKHIPAVSGRRIGQRSLLSAPRRSARDH